MLWTLALGCTGPDIDGRLFHLPDPPDPTTAPGDFPAVCVRAANNALRASCQATFDRSAPLRLEVLDREGMVVRTFEAPAAREHDVLVYGVRPDTTYTARFTDVDTGLVAEAQWLTGSLPLDVAQLTIEVTVDDPARSAIDTWFLTPSCPANTLVVADRTGSVVWYQTLEEAALLSGNVNAATVTEDNTVLAEVSRSTIVEVDWLGRVLARFERGVHFTEGVHHELYKKDGYIYALYAALSTVDDVDYVLDGVYVLEPSQGLVADLWLGEVYPLSTEPWMLEGYWTGVFPDAVDFSHANSVYVDGAGDLWVSFRHLHAFAKLSGGPESETFGDVLFTAAGSPQSPVSSPFVVDGLGFSGQHDVHLAQDGTVLLFDNQFGEGLSSARGVRYAIDEASSSLTELASWELDLFCPVQGAVRELGNGNVLLTCASSGAVREVTPGGETVWSARATCRNVFPAMFARAIPVSF